MSNLTSYRAGCRVYQNGKELYAMDLFFASSTTDYKALLIEAKNKALPFIDEGNTVEVIDVMASQPLD